MGETNAAATDAVQGAEVLQAGESRLARVESLRGLAAMAVAVAHAWGIGHFYIPQETQGTFFGRIVLGGGFGVFLFFALSGYLLFWPFARRYFGSGEPINLRIYAFNRAVRILPLYFFAVILLLLLQEHGGSGEQWWRFMTLSENFSKEHVGTVDGVLWSVVVEVHFYILLPLLALVTARLAGRSKARAALFLTLLGGVSLYIWFEYVQYPDPPANPVWRYNFPATFFYFIPGMLLALIRLRFEERRPAWLDWPLLGSSAFWLLASAASWLFIFHNYVYNPAAAIASFFAVGACVLPLRESRLRKVLDWRPLAAIGVVSYSLYVWHAVVQQNLVKIDAFPDGTLAITAIGIPLGVAVAFVSYKLVEEPFLRLRRRWSPASAPVASSGTRPTDI